MYQTYRGQVRNGQPFIAESVKLPENAEIIITILDDVFPVKISAQKQNKALDLLSMRLNNLEDEPLDVEGAGLELVEKLMESAKYSNNECEDWDGFYEHLRYELNENL